MKVLITGGLGFIGSELVRKFSEYKYSPENQVVVFDNLSYSGFYEHIKAVRDVTVYNGDLNDKSSIESCFHQYNGFDLVIHAAAESAVDKSIKNYEDFINTNIMGSANLFSVCTQFCIPKVINFGTDEIFGHLDSESASFNESSPIKPRNVYSASKAAQVLMAQAFKETHNLQVINVCPSNCYGPRQLPEKLLPRMIYLLRQGKELPIYGTGKNIREWLFVSDVADAIKVIALEGKIGELYTIGSNNEMSNLDVLNLLAQGMGVVPKFKFIDDRKGHDFRYSIDFSKIRALGWEPKTSLVPGLRETISWYDRNSEWLETQYKKMWKDG